MVSHTSHHFPWPKLLTIFIWDLFYPPLFCCNWVDWKLLARLLLRPFSKPYCVSGWLQVQITASWALANLCDVLGSNVETTSSQEARKCRKHLLSLQLWVVLSVMIEFTTASNMSMLSNEEAFNMDLSTPIFLFTKKLWACAVQKWKSASCF